MCGTAGLWVSAGGTDEKKRLENAIETIRHRGPDDTGFAWSTVSGTNARIGLALARLAILDLSPSGHQPMTSHDGRFLMSYNGEITNYAELRDVLRSLGHSFRSNSDTEVLVQAWQEWGESALSQLEGMYAMAIHDRERETLTLARDGYGIKPLYYFADEHRFGWCSELPGLLRLRSSSSDLDRQVALDYLNWGLYDNGTETFVDGIRQLAPGHVLQVDLHSGQAGTPRRYWWPAIETTSRDSFTDAADRVREEFLRSVRINLRSDVPVAIALSGGIDSSAIAAAVRSVEPEYDLHTFSYVAADSALSEQHWIDLVNQRVRATGHRIDASGDHLKSDLDRLILAQGEPFGSTSIYAQFRVFQKVREDGFVVTLDGQGADELFAGYSAYPAKRLHSLIETGHWVRAQRFLSAWGDWPGRSRRQALVETVAQFAPRALVRRVLGPGEAHTLLGNADASGLRRGFPGYEAPSARGARLKGHLRSELTRLKLPALLRHGDRNSMAFSVESRVPFLDRALTEYVLSLPESYLLGQNGESKRLLRAALRGIVPDEILDRRDKIGFETPQSDWLDAVSISADSIPDFLNPVAVHEVLRGPVASVSSGLRWRVINLVRWAEVMGVRMDAGAA